MQPSKICTVVNTGILESLVLKYSTQVLYDLLLDYIRLILISLISVENSIFYKRKELYLLTEY